MCEWACQRAVALGGALLVSTHYDFSKNQFPKPSTKLSEYDLHDVLRHVNERPREANLAFSLNLIRVGRHIIHETVKLPAPCRSLFGRKGTVTQ